MDLLAIDSCAANEPGRSSGALFFAHTKPKHGFIGCVTIHKKTSRRGVTVVEFALVAPIFLVLVFGLIELGRMVMVQQLLTNAAREGCRKAILATTMSSSDVETAVRDCLRPTMPVVSDASVVSVTVPTNLATQTSGVDLEVTVEVNYADVSWLPLGYLGLNPRIGAKQISKRE